MLFVVERAVRDIKCTIKVFLLFTRIVVKHTECIRNTQTTALDVVINKKFVSKALKAYSSTRQTRNRQAEQPRIRLIVGTEGVVICTMYIYSYLYSL